MGDEQDDEPVRKSWHGMGQRKPKLPYYLRSSKRLKSLDEWQDPDWKGRVRFGDEDRVTLRGVVRETFQWLVIFFIVGVIATSAWRWLYGSQPCAEVIAGFKIGWC